MIDRTSLLTWLPRRFGFNSRGLKSIGLISSSADVRRSRGKFNQIRRLITMNHALIGSQSSLNTGESWWTQDLPSNSLNFFMNRSKVEKTREEYRFLKRSSRDKRGPFDPVKGPSMAMITRWSWAMIARWSWATNLKISGFAPSDRHQSSRWVRYVHVSLHDAPRSRFNQSRLIFINAINGFI